MQLQDYLKSNAIKVADFAQSVGASEQAVYKWMKGERKPRDVRPIVEFTGGQVTANDFYGFESQGVDFNELGADQ